MKVKITKLGKPNIIQYKNGGTTEMELQNMGSNPLKVKEKSSSSAFVEPNIGFSYPEEDKGQGTIKAEKGEFISKVDGKLFKINGKTHKNGGTDINAENGDFIFSNSLKLKGDIVKTEFDLDPKKEYSFAEIANKYKNMNEFHKLATSKSPLDKKTGEMMMDNYHNKLAKLAFLQESQKGLPNGIPQIAMPLVEKAASIPQESIPEGSMMKRGGEMKSKTCYDGGGQVKTKKGMVTVDDTKKFESHRDVKSNTPYDAPADLKPSDFYQQDVVDFLEKLADEAGIDSDKGNPVDYSWGARHQKAYDEVYKKRKKAEPAAVIDQGIVKKEEEAAATGTPKPGDIKPGNQGVYKDFGYSTAEHLALANSLKSIPYNAPTRFQNYGLQQSQGIMSNINPFNYQSLINESNRSGQSAINANTNLSRNSATSFANNAYIAGQLAENTSKIKGDEYNQNANLYNNNSMQLANIVGQIGQDKMQNAIMYNNQVIQGKENLWGNRMSRDKQFVQEFGNANLNRSSRNAYGYLGQSVMPQYQMMNADGMIGFNAMQTPFTNIGGNSGQDDFESFKSSLPAKVQALGDEKLVEYWLKYRGTETTRNVNTRKVTTPYIK